MYYITKKVYDDYLKAKKDGKDKIILSFDLGISKTLITIEMLDKAFAQINKIKDHEIFIYDGTKVFKPQVFDNGVYSLALDENNFPCLFIDGVKMNVGKEQGVNEYNKKVIENLKIDDQDYVLETCMALGYKSIKAAEIARRVVSIEKSNAVIELAKLNPYSKALFKYKNIKVHNGNAFDIIKTFGDKSFTKIIHDPPTFKFAPELYSDEFYLELDRVAKEGARLFHYTGSPGESRGKNILNTTIDKLSEAGWKPIKKSEMGVYCIKES